MSPPAPAPRARSLAQSGAIRRRRRLLAGHDRRGSQAAGALPNLEFVEADATKLPFGDDEFDAVTISFGLRNVERPEARRSPRCSACSSPAAAS